MAQASTDLKKEKARLIAETDRQRAALDNQCQDLQLAAAYIEKGHQIAFTALQARKRLAPAQSLFSKKSWLSIPGFVKNAETVMGLIQTVRSCACRNGSTNGADLDFTASKRF
jgi:hypothetical protein